MSPTGTCRPGCTHSRRRKERCYWCERSPSPGCTNRRCMGCCRCNWASRCPADSFRRRRCRRRCRRSHRCTARCYSRERSPRPGCNCRPCTDYCRCSLGFPYQLGTRRRRTRHRWCRRSRRCTPCHSERAHAGTDRRGSLDRSCRAYRRSRRRSSTAFQRRFLRCRYRCSCTCCGRRRAPCC